MTIAKLALTAAVLNLVCLASEARARDAEEKYIRTRDEYLHHFAKGRDEKGVKSALADLEEQLRLLIGPSKVEGFSAPGKINLESLDPEEPGSDQLDGLSYTATIDDQVVATTPRLLENFLERHPKIPRAQDKRVGDSGFLTAALDWDTGFWDFGEIPIRAKAKSAAHASLVYQGQDTILSPPHAIVVLVTTASRILVMYKRLTNGEVTQIPACGKKWELTRGSGMNDTQFEAYASCWRKRAKGETFFRALRNQAQALVERFEP